ERRSALAGPTALAERVFTSTFFAPERAPHPAHDRLVRAPRLPINDRSNSENPWTPATFVAMPRGSARRADDGAPGPTLHSSTEGAHQGPSSVRLPSAPEGA